MLPLYLLTNLLIFTTAGEQLGREEQDAGERPGLKELSGRTAKRRPRQQGMISYLTTAPCLNIRLLHAELLVMFRIKNSSQSS